MIAALVAGVGRGSRAYAGRMADRVRFVGAVLRASLRYPATARPLFGRTVANQVRFTAVQALWLVSQVALILGATVIVQAHAQAVRFGFADSLGRILTTVVVRELGPLLTAIVVLGRSGTAIAAELATNGVMGERDAMEAMGVDPVQYLILPRIVAGGISVALLSVYFVALTLAAGAGMALLLERVSAAEYVQSLRFALSPFDLTLTLVKGALFGVGITTLCSFEGLTGGTRPTDIPQCVTRGVVSSLLFVFVVSAVLSWVIFA